jgi:hypothetical protein
MWGQGLRREHTFAHLAASQIAAERGETVEVVEGPGAEPLRGTARSGAKIKARSKDGEVDVLLPSGGTTRETAGDRATFAMTFRSLFDSDRELRDFLDGEVETPASELFGENPATFPTVTDQTREMASRAAGTVVQLVLLDGGVNDAEFEEVLDPRGPDIAKINREIGRIFGTDLPGLVAKVRQAFPRAVIVVTGYYSVLSQESDRDDLEELFEYMSGQPELLIAINEGIQAVPVLREVLNLVGIGEDVDALIEKAIRRSVTAAAHAHFWSRRGLGSLPGVVYAFPAFRPRHALFAGGGSLVHQGYRPPGDPRHVVSDEMRDTRLASIPRRELLGTYTVLRTDVNEVLRLNDDLNEANDNPPPADDDLAQQQHDSEVDQLERDLRRANEAFERDLQILLRSADLPSQILRAARRGDLRALGDALDSEIGRIKIATIASFIHPNPAGAERYADRIVTAYRRHLRFSVREAVHGMAAGADRVGLSSLREHGVDPGAGLRQLPPIAFVDSVAVQLQGLLTGPPVPGGFVITSPMTLGPRVSFDVVIPFGMTTLFRAFDTNADVRLADITEITFERGLVFEEVELFINGRTFFRGRRDEALTSGDTVTFQVRR